MRREGRRYLLPLVYDRDTSTTRAAACDLSAADYKQASPKHTVCPTLAVNALPLGNLTQDHQAKLNSTLYVQVSAEVASASLDIPITLNKVHKSADAEVGIRAAMQHCFLFSGDMFSCNKGAGLLSPV